jgi:hypothetical protein
MNPTLQALLRHILTAGGAALAARYGLDSADVEGVAGAVVTLLSIAWSLYDKRAAARAMLNEVSRRG